MISREDIKRLLLERKIHTAPAERLGYDMELALDSLSLVWFLHALEQEYGLQVDLEEEDAEAFSSINSIHGLLTREGFARDGEQRNGT